MLYRHVVPGLVGRSGAANAVVSEMKKNIGDMLSREAFNIDPARIDPAVPKPGNEFGFGSHRGLCVIYGSTCFRNIAHRYRSSCSFFLCASFRLPRTHQDSTTGISSSLCGTECARISSARKQLPRFGSLPVKESLFAITTRFIPVQRW